MLCRVEPKGSVLGYTGETVKIIIRRRSVDVRMCGTLVQLETLSHFT